MEWALIVLCLSRNEGDGDASRGAILLFCIDPWLVAQHQISIPDPRRREMPDKVRPLWYLSRMAVQNELLCVQVYGIRGNKVRAFEKDELTEHHGRS